jgi:hypothetical protein
MPTMTRPSSAATDDLPSPIGNQGSRPQRSKRKPRRDDTMIPIDVVCQGRSVGRRPAAEMFTASPSPSPSPDAEAAAAAAVAASAPGGGRGGSAGPAVPGVGFAGDVHTAGLSRSGGGSWRQAATARVPISRPPMYSSACLDCGNGDMAVDWVDGTWEVRVEWVNRDAAYGDSSQGDVAVARCSSRAIAKVRMALHRFAGTRTAM